MKKIDINCDLAEGGGNDAELMTLISSCNIACGGHFGNRETVAEAVKLAIDNDVHIGAHPSFPDKLNFGRKDITIPDVELKESIKEQILLVKEEAEKQGSYLHHIKAHGALYHRISKDRNTAELFIDVVLNIDDSVMLFVPPNSILQKAAKGKLKIYIEGFADRAYNEKYNLLPRSNKKAVIHDKNVVAKQVIFMLNEEKIPIENGKYLDCNFDTICVHGDNSNVIEILNFLHQKLKENNIKVL